MEHKSIGFIDDKGRIVIPAAIRDVLEFKKGDAIRIEFNQADGIILMYAVEWEKK